MLIIEPLQWGILRGLCPHCVVGIPNLAIGTMDPFRKHCPPYVTFY